MGHRNQHDAAFKGVIEHILSSSCVRTFSGLEVAKFPLKVDLVTERLCPLPPEFGLLTWLINQLPPFVVYEFKGPTDTLREQHIWRLLAYAALFAMEKNLSLFKNGIAAVVVFVKCSKKLRQLIKEATVEISAGIMAFEIFSPDATGLQLLFIDIQQLDLTPENLPFLLFREDVKKVLQLILTTPQTKKLYGYLLYKIQRKKVQDILKRMDLDLTEVATVKDMINDFGIKKVIEEVGLKKVIEEVGLKKVIEEVGLKKVIEEVGTARLLEMIRDAIAMSTLTAEDIKYLKQLVAKIEKVLNDKSRDI